MIGCKAGGGISNNPAPAPAARPVVPIPTITTPSTRPYYSNGNSLTIAGQCQEGDMVILSGDADDRQLCVNSAYSFSVSKSTDRVYTFTITQINTANVPSISVNLLWVRKTSIAPPTVTTPATNPFLSAQSALAIAGSCETDALVSLTGDATMSATCVNSAFAFNVPKAADGDYAFAIAQTDAAGNTASVNLAWKKHVLAVTPNNPTLVVNTAQPLVFSGGSGSYTLTIVTNNSGGHYDSVSGNYVTGTVAGVSDSLLVTDSLGASAPVTVTTVPASADHLVFPAASGTGASAPAGQALAAPVKVMVSDRYGNGVANYVLAFDIVSGDARFTTLPVQVSDANGLVQVQMTMGYAWPANTVVVAPLSGTLPDVDNLGKATLTFQEFTTFNGKGGFGPTFAVGQNPSALVRGDFDGDGSLDVAVLNSGDPSVGILLGKGNGLFKAMTKVNSICAGPNDLAAGDFNGDGKVDLVIACSGSDMIAVLTGAGDGTFTVSKFSSGATEVMPSGIVTGDFNGDGKIDFAVTAAGSNLVGVWFGNGNGTFQAPVEYGVGQTPNAITAVDLDGDGKLDLIVVNVNDNDISVLHNGGTGVFTLSATYPAGNTPSAVKAADLDGDSKPDVAVVNNADGTIALLINDGSGGLTPTTSLTVGANPTSVAIADVNGDGHVDLAVTNSGDGTVSLLYGTGGGNFSQPPSMNVTGNPLAVVAGDFNGDTRSDLVLIGGADTVIQVLPSQGALNLMSYQTATGANPTAVVSADFDGDGKIDLAVLNATDATVGIYQGTSRGLFTLKGTVATSANPSALLAGDFNRDGKMDLVVLDRSSATANVFLGRGDGTFMSSVAYTTGQQPVAVASGDLNGDGAADLVVVNATSSTVSMLLGNGDGTFQTKIDAHTTPSPQAVALADLNRDGKMDVVVTGLSNNVAAVHLGNGDGNLQAYVEYQTATSPNSLVIGDFNADSKLDLATANVIDGSVSILLGAGDGSFATHNDYSCGVTPAAIVTGDFNGDGRLDLAVSNGPSGTMTLLPGAGNGQFNISNTVVTGGTAGALIGTDVTADGALDLILLDPFTGVIQTWLGN